MPKFFTKEFPAQAGMNRQLNRQDSFVHRVPRASGDEPRGGTFDESVMQSSPRKRG